jgi:hypothetical protein
VRMVDVQSYGVHCTRLDLLTCVRWALQKGMVANAAESRRNQKPQSAPQAKPVRQRSFSKTATNASSPRVFLAEDSGFPGLRMTNVTHDHVALSMLVLRKAWVVHWCVAGSFSQKNKKRIATRGSFLRLRWSTEMSLFATNSGRGRRPP